MQKEDHKLTITEQIVCRTVCAVACVGFAKATWGVSVVVLDGLTADSIFSNGDPFVVFLFPFVLALLLLLIVALFALAWITFISGAYAIHPPFAAWVMSKIR